MTTPPLPVASLYQRVTFADLPGWAADDHGAAFAAFRASCPAVVSSVTAKGRSSSPAEAALAAVCATALKATAVLNRTQARAFFEKHFAPHSVRDTPAEGLLTAYYEPVVAGARAPSAAFPVPLHKRPPDLVNLVAEADRGAKANALTHGRQTSGGVVPYASRQQIDEGALAGRHLELFFVADEVERFFLQIQGSGIIQFADGTRVRVGYDGKNGLPYTSVGRYLINTGVMGADQMTLQALAEWLRADPDRGRRAMWQNKSYVFFREMPGAAAAEGVMGIALTPLRSLAVDPAYHPLGTPIFVDAPEITHITGKPFHQLMVGHDVGSAIHGKQRGDIFVGSGPDAGLAAGTTKHRGRFFVLLPVTAPVGQP